jgi:mRNA interferase RelE/StbE
LAYTVTLSPAADKIVARLPQAIRRRIAERLKPLADNPRPHGSMKLKGEDAYRIRVGDYRIIYTVKDNLLLVLVVDVGHRSNTTRRQGG